MPSYGTLGSELAPWLAPYAQWLYNYAVYMGWRPTVTSVYRSPQKQAVLYDRWRRGQSDIPAAPPGRSLHQQRRAFDLVVSAGYRSPQQRSLGSIWIQLGGRWYNSDPVHFEA